MSRITTAVLFELSVQAMKPDARPHRPRKLSGMTPGARSYWARFAKLLSEHAAR